MAGSALPVELRFVSFGSLGFVELQMDEERSLVILKGVLNMPIFWIIGIARSGTSTPELALWKMN